MANHDFDNRQTDAGNTILAVAGGFRLTEKNLWRRSKPVQRARGKEGRLMGISLVRSIGSKRSKRVRSTDTSAIIRGEQRPHVLIMTGVDARTRRQILAPVGKIVAPWQDFVLRGIA